MTDESIFDGDQTGNGIEQAAPLTVTLPDNVKDLVGPGKKYATVEKALEALAPSQNHIANLERELKELREGQQGGVDLDTVYATVQDLLAKERETRVAPTVDESSLAGVVDRALTAAQQKAEATRNVAVVKEQLTKMFGDKVNEKYKAKAEELGVGVAFLNDLAARSPKAVLEFFGGKPNASPARTHSSINTEALNTRPQPPAQGESVMNGASTKKVTDAWQRIKSKYDGQ